MGEMLLPGQQASQRIERACEADFLSLCISLRNPWDILNMYTLPEWRGQGLATALLQEIIHFAKSTSIRRLWLHATESGRPIYEKAGFLPTSAEMEFVR